MATFLGGQDLAILCQGEPKAPAKPRLAGVLGERRGEAYAS